MTFSVDSVPLPPIGATTPGSEVARTSSANNGINRLARCLNTLLARHVGSLVLDYISPTVGAAKTLYYRVKTPYKMNWPLSACQLRVRYHYTRITTAPWTITITTKDDGGSTTDAISETVGGSTATGSGWRVMDELIQFNDTDEFFDIEVALSEPGDITNNVTFIAIEVVPPTVLPARVGGYNDGVIPLNITVDTASEKFVSTYFVRDMHAMAAQIFRRRTGMIITSSGALFTKVSGTKWDPYWVNLRSEAPARVSRATVWERTELAGTPTWTKTTRNVSSLSGNLIQVISNIAASSTSTQSVCAWWDDASYP